MNRFFIPMLAVLWPGLLIGQERLWTKDSFSLGLKSERINDCIRSFSFDTIGLYPDKTGLCDCILTTMASQLEFEEYSDLEENDTLTSFAKMAAASSVKSLAAQVENCKKQHENSAIVQKNQENSFLRNCLKNVREEFDLDTDPTLYCRCRMEKYREKGFKFNGEEHELPSLKANEKDLFENDCLLAARLATKSDCGLLVTGPPTGTVSLLPAGKVYKVRVSFGSHASYLVLDSGASDVLIGSETAAELQAEGVLSLDQFDGETDYELANGEKYRCRVCRLDQVAIGPFKIDNVLVVIADKEVTGLLGMSFLSRFCRITIDESSKKLFLARE